MAVSLVERLVLRVHYLVALTRRLSELVEIQDLELSAAIANYALGLHCICYQADTRSLDAKYIGKKFLRK